MGSKALFIEHPIDFSNKVDEDIIKSNSLPWGSPSRFPFTSSGPLLSSLFERAFIDGLHCPNKKDHPQVNGKKH